MRLLSKIPAEGYFYVVRHILKRKIIGSMEVQPVTQWTGIQLRAKHLLLNFFADTAELEIQRVADAQDLLREHQIPLPQIPAVGQYGNTHRLIPPSTGPFCSGALFTWACCSARRSRISWACVSRRTFCFAAHAR